LQTRSSRFSRMTIWLNAHRSSAIAVWITATFGIIAAIAVRDLGLRESEDTDIFDQTLDF